jgi:hypothetical protein
MKYLTPVLLRHTLALVAVLAGPVVVHPEEADERLPSRQRLGGFLTIPVVPISAAPWAAGAAGGRPIPHRVYSATAVCRLIAFHSTPYRQENG